MFFFIHDNEPKKMFINLPSVLSNLFYYIYPDDVQLYLTFRRDFVSALNIECHVLPIGTGAIDLVILPVILSFRIRN